MGLIKGGGGGTYLRVRGGKLSKKVGPDQYEEWDGFEGVITGVRYEEGERTVENKPNKYCSLMVRMLDTDTGEEVIIVGPMFYYHKLKGSFEGISVWSRMLLARLCAFQRDAEGELVRDERNQPKPILTKHDRVALSFYAWNESTCVAVRKDGGNNPTIGGDAITDPDRMISAIAYLTERYGPWERGVVPAQGASRGGEAIPPEEPSPAELDPSGFGSAAARNEREVAQQRKDEDLPF